MSALQLRPAAFSFSGAVRQWQREQRRYASLLRRPKRPYTFTQLITLSDGSTFTHRTTSPQPVYRSTKDTKNSPLWNPSSQRLLNVEEDEAGRLKRFRGRFGRGWDAEVATKDEEARDVEDTLDQSNREDSLLDLISGYGREAEANADSSGVRDETTTSGKGKVGKK